MISGFDKEINRLLFVDGQAELASLEWWTNGPVRQGIKAKFTVVESEIEQKIYLTHNSKRLEFETKVNWRERHKMRRVGFNVNVRSQMASYDIQYGYLQRPTHRNTSWDMAKFVDVAYKFVDLSDQEYGVALLKD